MLFVGCCGEQSSPAGLCVGGLPTGQASVAACRGSCGGVGLLPVSLIPTRVAAYWALWGNSEPACGFPVLNASWEAAAAAAVAVTPQDPIGQGCFTGPVGFRLVPFTPRLALADGSAHKGVFWRSVSFHLLGICKNGQAPQARTWRASNQNPPVFRFCALSPIRPADATHNSQCSTQER